MNQLVQLKPESENTPVVLETAAKPRAANSPKSLRTRARILDSAVRLFVEIGYHAATNAKIAEASRLTRGAMLYHFPDRESLLDAVIPHLQASRTRMLQAAMDQVSAGADRIEHAIDVYWQVLGEAPFVAFAELESAARTDAALRERLAGAQAAFDRADTSVQMFALVQGAEGPRFQASRDLARFLLEGLAQARLTYDAEGRTERLLTVVKRAARMLNRKGSEQDLWPD